MRRKPMDAIPDAATAKNQRSQAGDSMEICYEGFVRTLRNPIRVEARTKNRAVAVRSLAGKNNRTSSTGDIVAILGLGTMGAGMAANLLKAGFSVTVYNRTAAKAMPLIDAGARFASTPAPGCQNASVIISMLADDAVSREVWMGKEGALAATRKGAILIESSTVSPEWIAEFANAAVQARSRITRRAGDR